MAGPRPNDESGATAVIAVVEPAVSPQAVVDRAAWIARLTGSRLHLLLCDADVRSLSQRYILSNEAKEIAGRIRAAQDAILDDLAAPARKGGLSVDTEVLEERPVADGIVQRALEIEPRFVVKATTYHSQARRAIFVDTDWQLIRGCPYPLWLVKPHDIADRPLVLAAVDPTHEQDEHARLDRLIVGEAKNIAERSGGQLSLLHTFEPLTGIGAEATRTFKPIRLSVDELSEKMEREHREKLDGLAAELGIDPARTHQLPGSARDLLPYFAREKKADLVVMGAIARWGPGRQAIGSTAEKVLDDLPCDILIVKLPEPS